jgi:hypothetical protein
MQTFSVAAALHSVLTASVHAGTLSLDQEAELEAHQYFSRALTKCGDKYVSTRKDVLTFKSDVIEEYLEASLEVRPGRVTDIDRLNGIEWQGMFAMSTKAQRLFSHDPGQPRGRWSSWMPSGGFLVSVKKQGGQWIIADPVQRKAIDCTRVPQ